MLENSAAPLTASISGVQENSCKASDQENNKVPSQNVSEEAVEEAGDSPTAKNGKIVILF